MAVSIEEVFLESDDKMKAAVAVLEKELRGVRTGRASAGLLDGIRVEYYGQELPVNQVATVSVPEPRLIVIRPWDQAAVAPIEKAITASSLGLAPQVDKNLIRLVIPSLTEERRKQLVAFVKEQGEAAKVAIRNVRRDANRSIDAAKKEGTPEDECFKAKEEVQTLTGDYEKQVDKLVENKNKEILEG
jgi:ribosome recycling factor